MDNIHKFINLLQKYFDAFANILKLKYADNLVSIKVVKPLVRNIFDGVGLDDCLGYKPMLTKKIIPYIDMKYIVKDGDNIIVKYAVIYTYICRLKLDITIKQFLHTLEIVILDKGFDKTGFHAVLSHYKQIRPNIGITHIMDSNVFRRCETYDSKIRNSKKIGEVC